MTKVHYDKDLSGVVSCGIGNYDDASEYIEYVTCKNCLRIEADAPLPDQADFEKWLHSDDGRTAIGWLVLDEKHKALRLAYKAGALAQRKKCKQEQVEPHEIVYKTDYIKYRKD